MTTNTEAARQYLTERRNRLASEISVLEGRMTEISYLLSELETPVRQTVANAVPQRSLKGKKEIIFEALVAAGSAGLTRDEASAVTGILLGTASSNLAQLKTAGRATHKIPKYFAVVNDQDQVL